MGCGGSRIKGEVNNSTNKQDIKATTNSEINNLNQKEEEKVSKPDAQQNEKAKVIFVLGGPGSGKGTQCAKLVSEFGFIHISTGDLLRSEVENRGPKAEEIENILASGNLVPSHILVELIKSTFESHGMKGKFLLDGFPRSQENVGSWNSIINDRVEIPFLLFFSCSEETMEARLLKRGETSGRSDDNAETIKKRFNTFKTQTEPIVEMYEKQQKVVEISAEGTVDEIYDKLKTAIIDRI